MMPPPEMITSQVFTLALYREGWAERPVVRHQRSRAALDWTAEGGCHHMAILRNLGAGSGMQMTSARPTA